MMLKSPKLSIYRCDMLGNLPRRGMRGRGSTRYIHLNLDALHAAAEHTTAASNIEMENIAFGSSTSVLKEPNNVQNGGVWLGTKRCTNNAKGDWWLLRRLTTALEEKASQKEIFWNIAEYYQNIQTAWMFKVCDKITIESYNIYFHERHRNDTSVFVIYRHSNFLRFTLRERGLINAKFYHTGILVRK